MTGKELKKSKLPDAPGVYFFRDRQGAILYIGKATSLKNRVRSYFGPDVLMARGRLIVDMVALAASVDHVQADSVLEAMILEANLIKKHQPKYNTKEKDNKSYNYIAFTDEAFPKIMTVRGRILMNANSSKKYKYIYGPFPHGGQLKEAMKIIRRIFPYSDTSCVTAADQMAAGRAPKPCFNRQIGLCPGVCTGEVTEKQYVEQIRNLKLFFDGKKKTLLRNLEKQMNAHAKKQEFEKAAIARRTIFALNHIQDIALLKSENRIDESAGGEYSADGDTFRIEAYDIAHSSGTSVVGVMTVVEDGEMNKSQYRKFKIKINPGVNDTAAMKEIIRRRLGHLEWPLPKLIAVDGGQAQLNAGQEIVGKLGFDIPVVSVVKDERHRPRAIMTNDDMLLAKSLGKAILLANSEAHRFAIAYHRKKRDKII